MRREVRGDRPGVAARRRTGQRAVDPERPGVGDGLLQQRQVDRQRARLVEADRRGDLADRVQQRRRRRPRRAPPPRGTRPWSPAPAGPGRPPIASAISPRCAASSSSPSIAIVAPSSAASARSRSANATSGMERARLRPGRQGRLRAPRRRAARWCGRSPGRRTAGGRARAARRRRRARRARRARRRPPARSARRRRGCPGRARGTARGGPGRATRRRPPASPPATARRRAPVPTAPAPTIPTTGRSPGPACACGWTWSLACSRSPWRWVAPGSPVPGPHRATSPTGSPPAPVRVAGSRSMPWCSRSWSVSSCSSARRSAWRRRTSSVSSQALIRRRRARVRARCMLPPNECSERSEGAPSSPDFHDGDQTVSTPNAFGARASLGAGLPDLYRLDALAGGAVAARHRPRSRAGHPQDPARERAAPRRRRHRPRGRRRRARRLAPRRRGRGRGAVHAQPGRPPGLHRRPRRGGPRGDARRDGGARRRPARRSTRSCPRTSSSTTRSRSTPGAARARSRSTSAREYERNGERYQLLRWAQTAFRDLRVVPPGTGIIHQVNLEYLATVVTDRADEAGRVASRTRWSGTDSHTTMINGLGVLGYGVGGIEAEAVLLGQPLYQPMPRIVGVRLTGELPRGRRRRPTSCSSSPRCCAGSASSARSSSSPGDGLAGLSLADRATISNMSPEFGATTTLFPIDDETLAYLRLTGRAGRAGRPRRALRQGAGPVARARRRPGVRRAARARPRHRGAVARRAAPAAGPGRAVAACADNFRAAFPHTVGVAAEADRGRRRGPPRSTTRRSPSPRSRRAPTPPTRR